MDGCVSMKHFIDNGMVGEEHVQTLDTILRICSHIEICRTSGLNPYALTVGKWGEKWLHESFVMLM